LGLIDQLTAVLLAETVALNCWLCPAVRVTLGGLTDTVTGMICNVRAFDGEVPGLATVMLAVPDEAISDVGTAAVSCVVLK
jgi:hypothetical protein